MTLFNKTTAIAARTLMSLSLFILLSLPVSAAQLKSDYTTAYRYNLLGQVTGVIQADPDGDGDLPSLATRHTYNAQGLLETVEQGQLSVWQDETIDPSSWAGFTIDNQQRYVYDHYGRKINSTTSAGGTTYGITDYEYYSSTGRGHYGRLKCQAVRMSNTTSPSACTAYNSAGINPDRVTRYTYDNFDQVLTEERAVDTADEQTYVTNVYAGLGRRTYVTDANGNVAHMKYDNYDRMTHWYFPGKGTADKGDSFNATQNHNLNDFEHYQYDNNGNVKILQKRSDDGIANNADTITYTYDALNQATKKDYSVVTDKDVFYGYDFRGLQLYARFSSNTGSGVTTTYDGFGNINSSSENVGGSAKSSSYGYDLHNNRSRITHSDNQVFSYGHDNIDRLTGIYKGSVKNTANQLITQGYNDQGLRSDINRGTGAANSNNSHYAYDDINRLNGLTHTLTSNPLTSYGFSYNRASQVIEKTLSNDQFNYVGEEHLVGDYQVNGLNQYTDVGGERFTYDVKGNFTSDGYTTYTFDTENRLLTASGSNNATLTYDPNGRLVKLVSGGATGNTTRFVYDGDALIGEYNASGALQQRYVHGSGIDEPLVMFDGGAVSDTSLQYLHSDYQGSIVALSDSDNALTGINTYDVYGIAGEGNVGRFAYTGQLWLPEIGLYYYKARIYHPKLGRFLQTDPIGYEDQMNLYGYVGNDPMNYTDPTGEAKYKGDKSGYAIGYLIATIGELYLAPGSSAQKFASQQRQIYSKLMTSGSRGPKTHVTYTKVNKKTREVYSGRTSGHGDANDILRKRDGSHHKNADGFGKARIDKVSTDRNAIRGREQQLIDANGGAKSQGGTSGNAINGISPTNKNSQKYENAANNAVWKNCSGALSVKC